MRTGATVAVLAALAGSLAGQAPETRTWRIYQGTAELGRETVRLSAGAFWQEAVVPVINLRVRSESEWSRAGLDAFRMEVATASGDTSRGSFTAERQGDSLRLEAARGGQDRRSARAADADLALPQQSVGVFEVILRRAAGHDTTFRLLVPGVDTLLPGRVRFHGDSASVTLAGLEVIVELRDGRATRITVPRQRVHALPAGPGDSLPPLSGLQRPTPDYGAPAGADWSAEAVRVPVGAAPDSFSLACTLTRPGGRPGKAPVVITITGSGSQTRDEDLWPLVRGYRPFGEIAEALAEHGVATLRCDDRGTGGSGGSAASATTADLSGDTRAQIVWVRRHPGLDGRRIVLIGHSEGGLIAPMVAASDRSLAGLVLMAGPAKRGVDILVDQVRWPILSEPGRPLAARTVAADSAEAAVRADSLPASAWLRWFRTFDPLTVVRQVRQPVLILQGALDRQVSAGQADTLARTLRASGNRRVEEETFPGLNHLFLPSISDGSVAEYPALPSTRLPAQVLARLVAWVTSTVGAR